MSSRTCSDIKIPLYLSILDANLSSTISCLRFNRPRLNQSLHRRACAPSTECSTCLNNTPETVEHILMHCPRYDIPRFDLFCHLSLVLKIPPLTLSFPFPFLL